MKMKFRFLMIFIILSMLAVSCGGGAATEEPAATEPPATESPATEEPAATEPTATEPQGSSTDAPSATEEPATELEICSETPDGLGQAYTSRPVATTYLGDAHGKYVYEDVLNQIDQSGGFIIPTEAPASFTDVVVILVVDTFPDAGVNENKIVSETIDSFIKGVDLYLDKETNTKGLLIVAVDTNDLNFDDISNNLPAAIDYFVNHSDVVFQSIQGFDIPLPQATGIVVNMSFVFVPCDFDAILNRGLPELLEKKGISEEYQTVEALSAAYNDNIDLRNQITGLSPLKNLEEKLTAVDFSDRNNAVFHAFLVYLLYDSEIIQSWLSSPASDKLRETLQAYSDVVYVGAAGNFENPYPFAPASWDFVISVSAEPSMQSLPPLHSEVQNVDGGLTLAKYSNWGEVQLNGDFWNRPDAVYGTSFAAPKFSGRVAQHLLFHTVCPQALNSTSSLPADLWENKLYNCTP